MCACVWVCVRGRGRVCVCVGQCVCVTVVYRMIQTSMEHHAVYEPGARIVAHRNTSTCTWVWVCVDRCAFSINCSNLAIGSICASRIEM